MLGGPATSARPLGRIHTWPFDSIRFDSLQESPGVLGPTKEEFGGARSRAVVFLFFFFFFTTKTVAELLKPPESGHESWAIGTGGQLKNLCCMGDGQSKVPPIKRF